MTTKQKILFGLTLAVLVPVTGLMIWAVATTPADRPR
jgi:hypothetical protein